MVLHYFLLVAFMWMFIEGFQLYRIVTNIFDSRTSKTIFVVPLAYIIPLAIVIFTVAAAMFMEGDFIGAYAGDETYVLSNLGL